MTALSAPTWGMYWWCGSSTPFCEPCFPQASPGSRRGVAIFAALVEVGQAFHLVDRLGLGHIPFFRILLGNTFDWADLLCYCAGGGLLLLIETLSHKSCRRR